MATKRSATSSMESPPSKRAKKQAELEKLEDKIEGFMDIFQSLDNSKESNTEINRLTAWGMPVCTTIKFFKPGKAILRPPCFSERSCAIFADQLYSLAKEYVQLKTTLVSMHLPPSQYANSAVWPTEQEIHSDILCLRPPGRTGVPLSTLHDAFHRFQQEANMTFQESPETIAAARAADSLSRVMGNPFEDEKDRTDAFNHCINPIFDSYSWHLRSYFYNPSEKCGGIINASFHVGRSSVATILRQDKKEPGHDGDAYMQIARGYQMYVKSLEDEKDEPVVQTVLTHGAPMFLLCVQGPVLSISGAFYDGKAVTVEPLCASPWMLRSRRLQRQLAQVLYALQRGVDNIQMSLSLPTTPLIPSVPRLYPACRKLDGTEVPIAFLSLFHASWNKPIFNVKLDGAFDALAKMTDRPYGAAVHQFLAEKGFAPEFLGTCTLDGRPTIYVMEKLDDSWMTLGTWGETLKSEERSTVRPQIYNGIMKIVGLLEGMGYVHGDLRTANIMIKKDTYEIKVIDFDWAGKAGQTFYPIDRNDEIKDWPNGSEQGGAIAQGHDRVLFENWWSGFLL